MSERVVAVVPVRTGSTRVPNKGIRDFDNTTLLENKIKALLQCKKLTDIVVSSDGEHILEMAKSLGVKTHLREKYYASSDCSGSEFFKNLAESIECDVLVYSPPTGPFVTPQTVDAAIEAYFNIEDIDSVATAFPVKEHLWLNGKPLNYDLENSPNSQDLPNILRITYGTCVISRKNAIQYRNVVGKAPFLMEIEEVESFDIDTQFEFDFAEFLMKNQSVFKV